MDVSSASAALMVDWMHVLEPFAMLSLAARSCAGRQPIAFWADELLQLALLKIDAATLCELTTNVPRVCGRRAAVCVGCVFHHPNDCRGSGMGVGVGVLVGVLV